MHTNSAQFEGTGRVRSRFRAKAATTALVVAGACALGIGVPPAARAATVQPGGLKASPSKAIAGDTSDIFAFNYNPAATQSGTIALTVPAGFSSPQNSSPAAAGYLATSSSCTEFQVAGVSAQAGGSSVVTIALNCTRKQAGSLTYSNVRVPTAAAGYAFPATFALTGAPTPVPLTTQPLVTVKPGDFAGITLTPALSTIVPGANQPYTTIAVDAFGNIRRDSTADTKLTISPNGSCVVASCTASISGTHTVTAKYHKTTATATLNVNPVVTQTDLAVAESVDNPTPTYYTGDTFTTTVTNLSTTTTATGVAALIPLPVGLISPTGGTGYNVSTGMWSIGSLAPGGTATLAITGLAGDVNLLSQTVTATVQSTTNDPVLSNNTASSSEASTPAPVSLTITPDPANPPFVDVSSPGTVSWTASASNAANPAAPPPTGNLQWTCDTLSFNPCPPNAALNAPNIPTITFPMSSFNIDTYFLIAAFTPADPNYQSDPVQTTISFSTTNSGGG